MHYVYLIESEKDPAKRYIGFTDDLKQRLSDHNAGKSKYTSGRGPWLLVIYVGFRNRDRAHTFEKYLKVGSGHAFARRHLWQCSKHAPPELDFAAETVSPELTVDFLETGLLHDVQWVARQGRSNRPGQCPTGPGARPALLPPGMVHPTGVMLKMHPGIAHEHVRRRVRQEPGNRGIRQWPRSQRGLVSAQFRPQGPVEAQQSAGGQAPLPQGMGVLETVMIKLPATHVLPMNMQRAPVEPGAGRRQVRTGRQDMGHTRFGAGEFRARQPPVL